MLVKETFDKHSKSKYWSDKNLLKPDKVPLNSHKKFWFNCDCGHEFETSCLNINQSNNWCPYCSKHAIRLCQNYSCKRCFNNSFASHEKSKYWSSENKINPRQVFKSTDRKKFKFDCDKCCHTLLCVLKKINIDNRWCAYCAHQKLCEDTTCIMCFNNSFASVERSKYLYDKKINPRMLFKNSNKKFEFNCNVCNNIWGTQLSNITNGVWCPYCVNKTEKKFYDEFIIYEPLLKRQFKVDWCKNIKHLPFDFVIEEKKIIIEIDGPHHLKQVSNWLSPEKTRKNDLYKMKCANENCYSIIRILQKDIYHNNFDWINEINNAIKNILQDNIIQNIYICKKDEYKDFDKEL